MKKMRIALHMCLRDNSLMFMVQNASVETVAARTYKTERNDFMLRAGGVFQ